VGLLLSKLTDSVPSWFLEKLAPKELFAKLNIANKMLLGYLVLVILTVVVVLYALVSLQRLNILNTSIVKVDVPVQDAAEKMLEAVIAQDTYEKRYLILASTEMRSLFWRRGEEFQQLLSELKRLPEQGELPVDTIEKLHKQYSDLFVQETQFLKQGNKRAAAEISNSELRKKSERLIEMLRKVSSDAKLSRDGKMQRISQVGRNAFFTTALLCTLSIVASVLGSLIVTHHISSSIHKLSAATEQIAVGNFDYDPQIKTDDEIGSLAKAFIDMGKRLRKLEEMYLDASPLTRLPGGIAIENVLKKRIESALPLAFCVFDLDNFKAFNDRYGYANGSEVIKETARIIENAVKERGGPDDFIGHVGGDDFVVITTPDHMRAVCEDVISRFDRRIPDFYDETARKAGYIHGRTRQGVEMKFPLMTISIAIVTNERRVLTGPLETSEIAAELKDYAKTIPKSVYVVDKRRSA
jgi:diguanylate cyclase (GGDEF)-like protein